MRNLLLMLSLIACSTKAAPRDHHLALPTGFVVQKPDGLRPGSYAYVEAKRANVEDAFLASIVVGPIAAEQRPSLSDAYCANVGDAFAKGTHNLLDSAQIVTMAGRKACQVHAHADDRPTRASSYTVYDDGSTVWGAVCSADTRDDVGTSACRELSFP
jgi:hypothetical protein